MRCGEEVGTLTERCAAWHVALPDFAVQLPALIAMMCLKGLCKELLLHSDHSRDRWRNCPWIPPLPVIAQDEQQRIADEFQDSILSQDFPTACATLAEALYQWSPVLTAHAQSSQCSAPYCHQPFLDAVAVHLHQQIENHLSKSHVGCAPSQGKYRFRYQGLFCLQCVLLADKLGDDSKLAAVIKRVGHMMQGAEDSVAQPKAPGAAVLSKARLALDLSFSHYWCVKHEQVEDIAGYYLLCDSSPQVGHDWFLTELWVLRGAEDELKELFLKMTSMASGLAEGPDKGGIVEQIQRHFYRHVCPPMVLGSKRGQLPHKLHALLQALFLESQSWRRVRQTLERTVSLTTDLGTESSLPTIKATDAGLSSCIPQIGDCATALADLRGEDRHLESPWRLSVLSVAGPALSKQ